MTQLAVLLLLSGALGIAACGKQDVPAVAPATAAVPTDAVPPGVATTAAAAPETAAAATPAVPLAEAISETDDAEPLGTESGSVVQPSLRLVGLTTGPATSARFKEGANYQRIVPAQPTSVAPDQVEVVEVFWYGCGHCFALDPGIEAWRAQGKPSYVQFLRVPAMWNDATRMHARVFYTAELLGKLEQLHTSIFREIHTKGNTLNTVDKIATFFKENGVSSDEFQKAFSSFAVESKLQRADFLNRRYKIESVPSMVVNGKYKTAVSDAGGEQPLFALIGELAAHEHGT